MFNQPYRPVTYKIGGNPAGAYPSVGGTGTGNGTGTGTAGYQPPQVPSGSPMTPSGTVMPVQIPTYEQSYIENILRLNLGKVGTFYMTYENNSQWNAKIFKGVLEAAGRDHIIISDPNTGVRTILLMVNLDYATFDQPLVYQYPGTIGNPPTTRR
ncbi:spore coat protein GerQ [Fontibacillus sp. BL9]|uniref:spore coat protein GerQ n=1 Tax=Fontibacillus sp. BL9 TaxID=3389971 RepID=UPI00397AD88F